MKPKTETLSWRWKERPSLDDLRTTLEPFGLFVYEDPSYEGMDYFGYLVSNKALTREEIWEERAIRDPHEDE
jgi:hypothetical protein